MQVKETVRNIYGRAKETASDQVEWKNQQSVCTPYMGTVEAIEMDPEEDHEDDQSTGAPLL